MTEQPSDRLGYPVVTVPESVASSPESVIRYLVRQLVEQGRISPEQAARSACRVIAREHQGSTALANGVAVPHSKTDVPGPVGIIGRSVVAIPWESPGGVPVREVCVLLLPVNDPRVSMRALREAVDVLSGQPDDPDAELDRRLAKHEADPANVRTWEQVLERIRRQP